MNRYRTLCITGLLAALVCFTIGCQAGKKNSDEIPKPPPEPKYRTDTVLLIESDGYGYLARVTEDTPPDATEVPVRFFSAEVRKKIGDTVTPEDILRVREEPPDGWASRPVSIDYFNGTTWKHQMDVLEMEDSYLLPERVKDKRRVEFANVRVPIALAIAETADAQTVHALLVIMDDDLDIAISVGQNRKRMRNFFDRLPGTKPEIYSAEEMRKTNELRQQHILDWIQRCPAGAQDTIFVYYSGHGHSDVHKRHYLDLRPSNPAFSVMRNDLAAALQAKPCRLKMLVTDTCSNFLDTQLAASVKQFAALQSKAQLYAKNLFLQHEGFLDITAASPGHFARGGDDIGGFFTTALITRSFTAESDTNGDRFLSWNEVFAKCKTETQNLLQQALPEIRSNPTVFLQMEQKKQTTQMPHNYAPLPTPTTRSRTTAPRLPTTAAKIVGNDGAEMVLIPAGDFQMGSNDGQSNEKPVHTVYVDAFYMDVYEVTNAQFKAFVDANPQWRKAQIPAKYNDGDYLKPWSGNNYPNGKDNHPVTYVSWYAAMAYAEWVGKRLPREAEWEKAARGGLQGQKYPWGNGIDASQANYGKNLGGTTAVGSYGANGYGLYDMAGNVWEWCLDAHNSDFYARSPSQNPLAGEMTLREVSANYRNVTTSRVLRGGSWYGSARVLRVANRGSSTPAGTGAYLGFRCARAVTP